jgi:hypothetical protein
MDDDLHNLEAELKRLRPAAPSREMFARLEAEFAPIAAPVTPVVFWQRGTRLWWLWAGALPFAAALVVAFVLATRRAPATKGLQPLAVSLPSAAATPPTEAVFKPVAAENVLYAVSDEGLVTLDDGTAARRERLSYVDTITWKNPRTNASVRWTVPREEVRVVPVKFQ